ncbi:MAG TPA: hypothetical protein VLG44_04560 [Chlamydiales bacterium]|nr:hypothetical protein [Chlamydiales bacterium]
MVSAVQSRGDSSPILLSQSKIPTWEVETATMRGTLLVELFNYKCPPDQVEQTISLAERAKRWQDLPKEQAICVLKCLAVALIVGLYVLNALMLNFHWALILGLGLPYTFAWHHILFSGEGSITTEVFSVKPDWETLDKERQELFQSYNGQMLNHIALLTSKIEEEERSPTPHSEDKLGRLITARDALQRLWNWVEKGQ